ncbi:MAG: hypothetical protein RL685_6419 [Pseudomonadota bacterium]
MTSTIYSIGHSRHPAESFEALLRGRGVELLADVRSHPASKWAPHFGKVALEQQLRAQGIGYEFLGRELGGRPQGAQYYGPDGALDYARRAEAADFQAGIQRLLALAQALLTVMLCAEEDPTQCHRRRLITPALSRAGVRVVHIRGDGRLEPEGISGPASAQLGLFR